MIKDENAEPIINGERVENEYTFIADNENMEVQISFTFDASKLGGKQLVTFEELYDNSKPEEPIKVTEHKDIEDEGQTVTMTEMPTPGEPTTPSTPEIPRTSDSPKTGDTTKITLLILGMVVSATAIGTLYFRRKKEKTE